MTASERQRILNLADGLEQLGRKLSDGLQGYLDLGAALTDQLRKVANGDEETAHVAD